MSIGEEHPANIIECNKCKCGVSGSGKTWVCEQVKDLFTYVPHDENMKNICSAIVKANADKPLITECPFGERYLKESLERETIILVSPQRNR